MNEQLLARCTEIPGVLGAFTLDAFGRITARQLPAFFAESSVANAGPRLGLLIEATAEAMADADDLHLVFEGFGLWIRRRRAFSLVMIAALDARPDMLRLAASQMSRLLEESARTDPTPTLVSRLEVPAPAAFPVAAAVRAPAPAPVPSRPGAASGPRSKPASSVRATPKKKNDIWGD